MKKVISIVSIVVSVFVTSQSFIAGLSNTLSDISESGGTDELILAILMLTAGIVVVVSRYSKVLVITSIVLYLLGCLVGFISAGSYLVLNLWSGISLLFGLLLICHLKDNKELYSNGSHTNNN